MIINHPKLYEGPAILEANGFLVDKDRKVGHRLSLLLPTSTFQVDGFTLLMVRLNLLILITFAICTGSIVSARLMVSSRVPTAKQDWEPIPLPANGAYGNCRQDEVHPEGVRFHFAAEKGQLCQLSYIVGGQIGGGRIYLSLNGQELDIPGTFTAGWGPERVVSLPPTHILEGSNIIEFKPVIERATYPKWGVKNVRVHTESAKSEYDTQRPRVDLQEVRDRIRVKNLSGDELAQLYLQLNSREIRNGPDAATGARKSLMDEIENEMKKLLFKAAIDVRYLKLIEENERLATVLRETREWIPPPWTEGWEIYNEFLR